MASKTVLKAEVKDGGTLYTYEDGTTEFVKGEFIQKPMGQPVRGTIDTVAPKPSPLDNQLDSDEEEDMMEIRRKIGVERE